MMIDGSVNNIFAFDNMKFYIKSNRVFHWHQKLKKVVKNEEKVIYRFC